MSVDTPVNQALADQRARRAGVTVTTSPSRMDIWIVAAIAMLIVWAVATFAFPGPGWVHLLLTVGVFVLIWRIVVRGTPPRR